LKLKAKNNSVECIEEAKKKAALEAVKHVENRFVIGLGSGSTAAYAIQEVGRLIHQKNLKILGVPTSYQSFLLAVDNGIPISTLNEHPKLNLTIDGADQVDRNLNMIKGMGGALTKEKVVALASKQNITVIDERKLTKKLGTNQPVPIEVLPFAIALVKSRIKKMKGNPILREGKGKVGPVITDNGNFIVDVDFGLIDAPDKLNSELKLIPGLVETGLFIKTSNIVYVGTSEGVHKLEI
jgi:ribose 5-phosphate isomerase A